MVIVHDQGFWIEEGRENGERRGQEKERGEDGRG